jgi:hypothetical protein
VTLRTAIAVSLAKASGTARQTLAMLNETPPVADIEGALRDLGFKVIEG